MKMEITIPDYLPDLKEGDLKAAAKRREKYSLVRDLQAKEFNEAIVIRLAKNREKQECSQSEDRKQVKCEKCGKEFSVGITTKDFMNCPECKQIIEIG
jgi:protein-arginine kinase activator protein McsA